MCNIMVFKPGVLPKKDQLFNCVYNNWHGYGLILLGDKKFEVIKRCPKPDGETDPSEIYNLLVDNKNLTRFLHVRHNTAGATSEDNTHPFEVYKSKTDEVYFMHNGTLYEYKSKKTITNPTGVQSVVDDDDGPSDTVNFNNRILKPLMESMTDSKNNKGSLRNPLFRRVVLKFWPTTGSNRGILIAKNQPFWHFGDWKEISGEGGKFLSSNDDYFADVIRGPEKIRRSVRLEAEKKAKESLSSPKDISVVNLKDFDFSKGLKEFKLSQDIKDILDDYEVWDRNFAVNLGNLTPKELTRIYEDKTSTISLMQWIFSDYHTLYQEFLELEEKSEKQEKHIERLVKESKKF